MTPNLDTPLPTGQLLPFRESLLAMLGVAFVSMLVALDQTIVGTALQYAAPWSWMIALVVVTLLWIRSHFEEQILAESFPDYGAYRARTKRFIPGVI